MQKSLRILCLILLAFFAFQSFCYATDINPDALSGNTTNNSVGNTLSDANAFTNTVADNTTMGNNATTNNTVNNSVNGTTNSVRNTVSSAPTPSVTSTSSSLPEAGLGLSTILSIVLIVIGALLFFLGIAILLRLK